ncbi:ligand-binding sensor domain-containing protein [Aridibaculum aurantiacum]|uniref:ligand-binding sensor domain-containing protein n=1 Tax=Aridibaculum aurantiacum TaxID=2810307 RepID=UPI001A97C0CA|nr:sensor histidine kinase [Aridibaculum aurantiacum]
MRGIFIILLTLLTQACYAQQGFAFTQITTDDGLGLASNVVSSLYQDEKGFIWVGTANGLQRFDGSKFIQFTESRKSVDRLPNTDISQIIPADSGKLFLAMSARREFGIFNPADFTFKIIPLKTATALPPRAEFRLWKSSTGEIYVNVLRYGVLRYNKRTQEFVDDHPFDFPPGWLPSVAGVHDDPVKQQVWFTTQNGLCVYDRRSKQMWSKLNNPQKLPLLEHPLLGDNTTEIFIDKQRRIWVFGWQVWGGGGQKKLVFDSTGKFLANDTLGLNFHTGEYTEYHKFLETSGGNLWIYGLKVLLNYDNNSKRFFFNRSTTDNNGINIQYDVVNQIVEDKDGSLWLATDKGLFYTSYGSGFFSVINLIFSNQAEATNLTDILEMPNGDYWFTSWGQGVRVIDKTMKKKQHDIYRQKPPKSWTPAEVNNTLLTWNMCRESSTGKIWIGCNGGVLVVHDPAKNSTEYLAPPEFNQSTIRYIVQDKKGTIWFSTQGGRLISWNGKEFSVKKEIGTIIYKVLVDKQGWLWLATHEKGLMAVDPATGNTLQHYTHGTGENKLYSNTGNDVELLNDSTIVFGAGALNFINKITGKVEVLSYEDGLPSNTVKRIRTDFKGYLWVVTANGLCRYNPNNRRITPYGRKDGIVMAEQTSSADYVTSKNQLIFAGNNAVLFFDPEIFTSTQPPPTVSITDFKLFNTFVPVDSLLQLNEVKLAHDQNSISIYFASLSYRQRDKLTYYYKMEGLDKQWVKADRSYYVNYSQLPPGRYTFKVFCENIEGMRSQEITTMQIFVRSPFWRTWWFYSSILFTIILLIYAIHDLRVNKLLAVEKIRTRVARDLHDDMGSTLSTINILSSMAKSKIATDTVKTSEYITKISDNSQRMMEAMDDIVWSIKPTNDSMQKITARMREFATNVLEAKEMDMDFMIDDQVYEVKLNMEARRDFFLIFKEAVNNAAKYSKAGKVTVHVTLENNKLALLVKDDGRGFVVKDADGGNGLGNMQKRADNVNGKINIKSSPGEGTTVKLVMPLQ